MQKPYTSYGSGVRGIEEREKEKRRRR